MPFSDPEKRRAADRDRYWRNKEGRARISTLWRPIDMLLALWCLEWKPKVQGLESLWRTVVPIQTITERSHRQVVVRGTRIMACVGGKEFRVCEYEGTDLVEKLQEEKEDFLYALRFQVYWANRR